VATDGSQHKLTIPWEKTRCAEIFKRNHHDRKSPSLSHYYLGTSLVTREHEKSCLEGHVIFQDNIEKKVHFLLAI